MSAIGKHSMKPTVKGHNRLGHKRSNDLVCVQYKYNLRKKEQQLTRDRYCPIDIQNIILEDPLEEWINEIEGARLEGDEVH